MIRFDPSNKTIFEPPSLNIVGSPSKALFIFDDEVWEDFVEKDESLKVFPAKNNQGRVFSTFRIYIYNDEKILLVYPNVGGSASAADLELLIASGIDKIVAFGTCGAMDKKIAKNTIIIPISAMREEGVSYHYLPPSDEVNQDKQSQKIMESVFSSNNLRYLVGKVWTTDAVYRETQDKLISMKQKGCVAVDMELASLLAVSQFRNIKFAEFLICDDNIDGKCDDKCDRNSEKLFSVALQILSKL